MAMKKKKKKTTTTKKSKTPKSSKAKKERKAKKPKAKKPKEPKKPKPDAPPATTAACPTLAIDDTIGQEHPNWCWAACIDVVVRFRTNPGLNQCDVAGSALGQACCGFGAASPCDVGQDTSQITSHFKTFGVPATEDVRLNALALTAELTAGRLVGVHINWKSGGRGHMLIVYGCAAGNMFHVYDPLGPETETITISDLNNYMDGAGTWDLSWRNL
jgi:hypothetical protein